MAGEVALRLLLKGGREVAAGLGQVTKETSALGKATKEAAGGAKALSGGLDSVQKQGLGATRTTKAYQLALTRVAEQQKLVAAAAKRASEMRAQYTKLAADATAKQAAGDIEAAKAAQSHADAMLLQARNADRMTAALRRSTTAAREQATAIRTAAVASSSGGGGMSGRAALFGGMSKVGGVAAKAGLAVGGYLAYEGVKRMGSFQDQVARLGTLANVPRSQLPALQKWMVSNSVGLREDPGTLATQMYRIASASPGKPYSANTLKQLTSAAAMFTTIGGPGTDPEQAARVFGIIRANGGLGTRNFRQIGGIATATIGSGDMTASDLIAALGTGGLAPQAARHKINMTQLGGVLAELGDLGVTGSMAGTRLQHAISLLASPSPAAAKIYGSLGISPTMIDQVIRTKGLRAGLQLLHRQMAATMPSAMVGQTASVGQLMGVGYSRTQAKRMQSSGAASMEDLMLTRAFGGARQSTPIVALFDALTRTGGKTAEVARHGTAAQFGSKFRTASTTPAQEWHRLDLDMQHLENTIGLKLIPKLIGLFNWVSRNKGALEDTAKVLGIAAIPMIGAYAASLTMRGISAVSRFTGALRGQNTELSKTGGVAAAQSRGIGVMGSAVMGLTTAIGVWELGKATRGHGAGGAVTAGLGGAMAGLTTGLMVGGPWGAAVGAATGAIVGLTSHFSTGATATDIYRAAIDKIINRLQALKSWESQAYKADRYRIGPQFRQSLMTSLQGSPRTTAALAGAGVRLSQITHGLKVGNMSGVENQLSRAVNQGLIPQSDYMTAMSSMMALQDSFQGMASNLQNLASLTGKTTQETQILDQQAQSTLDSITQNITGTQGGKVGKPGHGNSSKPKKGLGGLLNPTPSGSASPGAASGDLHVHVHANGHEIGKAVVQDFRDQQARL